MTPYTLGLIGYGGFGHFLHRAWSEMNTVTVQAVADVNPRRDPGGVRFYTDWRRLVADEHLDIVAIATPPATHAEIACAALEADKHILVEKPVATTLSDARRIQAVRDRTGRTATVDFMLRFNPIVEALQAWSRSGCFGTLRRVVVENYAQDNALPPDHWFWDPEHSGGILVEHAVHFIDIVNGCTPARPRRIDGAALRRNARQEDRMMMTVIYEDGLVASQYHAFARPDFFEHTSMRFVFDLAQLDVEGWIPLAGQVTALVRAETEPELDRLPGFRATQRQAFKDVQDDSRPEDSGEGYSVAGTTRSLYSSGEAYVAETMVKGPFAMAETKTAAYAEALRALMDDLVAALEDPGHRLRVMLEDGIASLEIALRATEQAHRASPLP